jgi:pullulanase/glycogen debranching enzyme
MNGWPDIDWRKPDGSELSEAGWQSAKAFTLLLADTADQPTQVQHDGDHDEAIAVLINGDEHAIQFSLPAVAGRDWRLMFSSDPGAPARWSAPTLAVAARSISCWRLPAA